MKVEELNIDDLKPYALNAKKHPQSQLEGIAESIRRFGFTQPIVIDDKNEIIIGHGRHAAAKLIGYTKVPCVKLDQLDERQVRALRLIDNRIAETGWDQEFLIQDLSDLDFSFQDFNIDFNFLGDEILKNEENKNESQTTDSTQFIVAIECENEQQQQEIFEELNQRGLKCKLIM